MKHRNVIKAMEKQGWTVKMYPDSGGSDRRYYCDNGSCVCSWTLGEDMDTRKIYVKKATGEEWSFDGIIQAVRYMGGTK